ncbi:AAA domain (dynein-related subfamily) [Streptomyces sp. cf124]|uniref:AAA family ATPase n=1 Tax=Streptomyces sp. cf124 TaxID=1761903 RepID=UPI0008E2BC0B|nr:MoxR family ATPase [Streptomyces sp. cf124]SFO06667.1 AAA domain (dynein-related subfamily) [Streptomyces sp. cf124]
MNSGRPQERLFRGDGGTYDDSVPLPEAPPWRRPRPDGTAERRPYLIGDDQVEVVNAALRLRRPLLVTGAPGTGKSSLAHAVAAELGLGPVLVWPVNTRATLTDALYRYDAIGRLRERQDGTDDIGSFVRLGPLGTALATRHQGRPRLLLIDELDKSDLDLPNDLLFVLEEGEFTIPELARLPEAQADIDVHVQGSQEKVHVRQGTVRCEDFPFVVITSNGEREFPPAFLRRCVRLQLPEPGREQLERIVRAHFTEDFPQVYTQWPRVKELIRSFVETRDVGGLATDQLLHAVHLLGQGVGPEAKHLREAVLRELRSGGPR